MENFEQSYT